MMTEKKLLTEQQIEELAFKIRELLLKYEIWQDINIYFNGKCLSTYDKKTGEFYYNEADKIIINENEDPTKYFEYVNTENHTISMSFEGPFYHIINDNAYTREQVEFTQKVMKEFDALLDEYGLYYELGYAWSLTCYY